MHNVSVLVAAALACSACVGKDRCSVDGDCLPGRACVDGHCAFSRGARDAGALSDAGFSVDAAQPGDGGVDASEPLDASHPSDASQSFVAALPADAAEPIDAGLGDAHVDAGEPVGCDVDERYVVLLATGMDALRVYKPSGASLERVVPLSGLRVSAPAYNNAAALVGRRMLYADDALRAVDVSSHGGDRLTATQMSMPVPSPAFTRLGDHLLFFSPDHVWSLDMRDTEWTTQLAQAEAPPFSTTRSFDTARGPIVVALGDGLGPGIEIWGVPDGGDPVRMSRSAEMPFLDWPASGQVRGLGYDVSSGRALLARQQGISVIPSLDPLVAPAESVEWSPGDGGLVQVAAFDHDIAWVATQEAIFRVNLTSSAVQEGTQPLGTNEYPRFLLLGCKRVIYVGNSIRAYDRVTLEPLGNTPLEVAVSASLSSRTELMISGDGP